MIDDSKTPFLTVEEAARYLRLKKRTLDNMRWMGTGPKFRKHGGSMSSRNGHSIAAATPRRNTEMTKRFRSFTLVAAALALTFLAAKPVINPSPILIWNASESVPIGWYFVSKRRPKTGEIAVIRPAEWVQIYASNRGYLPHPIINYLPLWIVCFCRWKACCDSQNHRPKAPALACLEGLQGTQTVAVSCPWRASQLIRQSLLWTHRTEPGDRYSFSSRRIAQVKFRDVWGVMIRSFGEGKIKAVVMVWSEVIDLERNT